MNIEYENGWPKGYLKRRKNAALLFIFSAYLYCIYNLLVKTNILVMTNSVLNIIIIGCLIFVSCIFLIYSVIAKKNFKELKMFNYNEVNTFSKLEKCLYIIPILAASVYIPLRMLILVGFTVLCYVTINSSDRADKYDSYI